MKEKLALICSDVVKNCEAVKIVHYGTKYDTEGKNAREISLCVVVREDPKTAEARLYRSIESELVVNLLLYSEEDFESLLSDSTSYAHSIVTKGTVLYG